MVELGHPNAKQYEALLARFRGLKYASGYDARYVAYQDDQNFVHYGAPGLDLSWGRHYSEEWDKLFGKFYGVCPADKGFADYIHAVAEAGWPKAAEPALKAGTFHISTTKYLRLIADALVICKGRELPEPYRGERKGEPTLFVFYGLRFCTFEQIVAMFKAVERRMGRWVLPPRTSDDDEVDEAPLPLKYKRFRLAGVKKVTVSDHAVLIPLIPLTSEGNAIIAEAIDDLVRLCEEGYPWKGECRDWVAKWLETTLRGKKWLRSLDKQFKDQGEP